MNPILVSALNLVISMLIGSLDFKRIESLVKEWHKKKLTGAEKRKGVLDQLEVIGLKVSENLARLAIEIAVSKLKSTVIK